MSHIYLQKTLKCIARVHWYLMFMVAHYVYANIHIWAGSFSALRSELDIHGFMVLNADINARLWVSFY